MKNQALFSSKDKGKKLKCQLQFLFGALMVKTILPLFLQVWMCSSTVPYERAIGL